MPPSLPVPPGCRASLRFCLQRWLCSLHRWGVHACASNFCLGGCFSSSHASPCSSRRVGLGSRHYPFATAKPNVAPQIVYQVVASSQTPSHRRFCTATGLSRRTASKSPDTTTSEEHGAHTTGTRNDDAAVLIGERTQSWSHAHTGCSLWPPLESNPLPVLATRPLQKKKRTHVVADQTKKGQPKSFVFRRGKHAVRGAPALVANGRAAAGGALHTDRGCTVAGCTFVTLSCMQGMLASDRGHQLGPCVAYACTRTR